jgi:hypothetical protein
MNSTSIRLDRLDLTVSGVSPSAAQAAIASLGPELARAIESRIQAAGTAHSASVVHTELQAGVVRVTSSTDVPALRTALAAQIARAALPNRPL